MSHADFFVCWYFFALYINRKLRPNNLITQINIHILCWSRSNSRYLQMLCDVHTSVSASQCWTVCEQAFCDDCVTYHSRAQTSMSHEITPIANYIKLPLFVTSRRRTCGKHDGEKKPSFSVLFTNVFAVCIVSHANMRIVEAQNISKKYQRT